MNVIGNLVIKTKNRLSALIWMSPERIMLEEIDRKGHILYSICVKTISLDLCAISYTSHF